MHEDVAHLVLSNMGLPGEKCDKLMKDDMKCVWKGEEFLALYYPTENVMELYGTKNTNSINFYINRYENLEWDSWHKVKTKRW